jgi:uncharacterized CHY-type Zn-finger protein
MDATDISENVLYYTHEEIMKLRPTGCAKLYGKFKCNF